MAVSMTRNMTLLCYVEIIASLEAASLRAPAIEHGSRLRSPGSQLSWVLQIGGLRCAEGCGLVLLGRLVEASRGLDQQLARW